MRLPRGFSDELRGQADIVRIVSDYVSLKKRGANYLACCPFHHEKTPSFNVNPTRQIFKCFGCNKGGDVFSFVEKIENITFPEAVRALAQKLGVALPRASFSSGQEAREARLRTGLLDIHERAVPPSLDVITATAPVRAVIELNGGTAARLGIGPGDRVIYPIFGNAS